MSTTTLHKTLFIDAPPESVWAFLVEKDKLARWYHEPLKDLANGEEYALYKKTDQERSKPLIWGKVLEMDKPERLVTTFNILPFQGRSTTITWILEPAAGGTRLSLTHEGIAEASQEAVMGMLQSLDSGWDEHFAELRQALKVSG